MNSKGSVEIQFNWIFVMIVGSVLLLFFYSIIQVQQKSSDKEIGYSTAVDLNTIFTSALESTGTLNIIKIPDTTIDFTCYEYYINNVNRPFNEKAVFAPDRLQGKRLMTWAVDWHAPYKVTNFLFVTNPEVRYIIFNPVTLNPGNPNAGEELFDYLPEELNAEYSNKDTISLTYDNSHPMNSIENKNDYKVRLVFFRDNTFTTSDKPPIPLDLQTMDNKDVTAIVVVGDGLDGSGTIYYYVKNDNEFRYTGSFPYLRYETILAGMFSENADVYKCAMIKAFKKWDIVARVYAGRTQSIADAYTAEGDRCRNYFTATHVNALQNNVATLNGCADNDLIYNDPTKYDDASFIQSMITDISAIERQNRDTVGQSCTRIY